jgi:hypothetical protein
MEATHTCLVQLCVWGQTRTRSVDRGRRSRGPRWRPERRSGAARRRQERRSAGGPPASPGAARRPRLPRWCMPNVDRTSGPDGGRPARPPVNPRLPAPPAVFLPPWATPELWSHTVAPNRCVYVSCGGTRGPQRQVATTRVGQPLNRGLGRAPHQEPRTAPRGVKDVPELRCRR